MAQAEFPKTLACSLGLGRNPVSQIREGMFLLVIRHETKPKQKVRLGLGRGSSCHPVSAVVSEPWSGSLGWFVSVLGLWIDALGDREQKPSQFSLWLH